MRTMMFTLALIALSGCDSGPTSSTKAEVLARQNAEQELSEQRRKVLDDAIACFRQQTGGSSVDCSAKMDAMDDQTAQMQAEINAREVDRAR